jgi:2'-5' RNA ligase
VGGLPERPAALDGWWPTARGARRGWFAGRKTALFSHVTLLRKAGAAEALPAFEAIDWPVAEWVLVESCRSGSGAAYRRLAGWPLT